MSKVMDTANSIAMLKIALARKVKGVTISEYLENIPVIYERLVVFNDIVDAAIAYKENKCSEREFKEKLFTFPVKDFREITQLISKRLKEEIQIEY
jgi:hypothetical protein